MSRVELLGCTVPVAAGVEFYPGMPYSSPMPNVDLSENVALAAGFTNLYLLFSFLRMDLGWDGSYGRFCCSCYYC